MALNTRQEENILSIRDKLSKIGSFFNNLFFWALGIFFLWVIIDELIIPYVFPAVLGITKYIFTQIIGYALGAGLFILFFGVPFAIVYYFMGDEINQNGLNTAGILLMFILLLL